LILLASVWTGYLPWLLFYYKNPKTASLFSAAVTYLGGEFLVNHRAVLESTLSSPHSVLTESMYLRLHLKEFSTWLFVYKKSSIFYGCLPQ
jgi:hypothetical protein